MQNRLKEVQKENKLSRQVSQNLEQEGFELQTEQPQKENQQYSPKELQETFGVSLLEIKQVFFDLDNGLYQRWSNKSEKELVRVAELLCKNFLQVIIKNNSYEIKLQSLNILDFGKPTQSQQQLASISHRTATIDSQISNDCDPAAFRLKQKKFKDYLGMTWEDLCSRHLLLKSEHEKVKEKNKYLEDKMASMKASMEEMRITFLKEIQQMRGINFQKKMLQERLHNKPQQHSSRGLQKVITQSEEQKVQSVCMEVRYFDVTKGIDEATNSIIEEKIQQMTLEFNLKLQALQETNIQLQKQINIFDQICEKGNVLVSLDEMNVESMVEKVYVVEKDPFKVWEAVDKVYGFGFFNEVIQEEYGITPDFTNKIQDMFVDEINSLKHLQLERINSVVSKAQNEIKRLIGELKERNNRMDNQRRTFFEVVADIRKTMGLELEREAESKFQEMRIEYKKQIKQLETMTQRLQSKEMMPLEGTDEFKKRTYEKSLEADLLEERDKYKELFSRNRTLEFQNKKNEYLLKCLRKQFSALSTDLATQDQEGILDIKEKNMAQNEVSTMKNYLDASEKVSEMLENEVQRLSDQLLRLKQQNPKLNIMISNPQKMIKRLKLNAHKELTAQVHQSFEEDLYQKNREKCVGTELQDLELPLVQQDPEKDEIKAPQVEKGTQDRVLTKDAQTGENQPQFKKIKTQTKITQDDVTEMEQCQANFNKIQRENEKLLRNIRKLESKLREKEKALGNIQTLEGNSRKSLSRKAGVSNEYSQESLAEGAAYNDSRSGKRSSSRILAHQPSGIQRILAETPDQMNTSEENTARGKSTSAKAKKKAKRKSILKRTNTRIDNFEASGEITERREGSPINITIKNRSQEANSQEPIREKKAKKPIDPEKREKKKLEKVKKFLEKHPELIEQAWRSGKIVHRPVYKLVNNSIHGLEKILTKSMGLDKKTQGTQTMLQATSQDIASIMSSKREELYSSAERKDVKIGGEMHYSSVDRVKERISSGGRVESVIQSPLTMMKKSPKLQEQNAENEISFQEPQANKSFAHYQNQNLFSRQNQVGSTAQYRFKGKIATADRYSSGQPDQVLLVGKKEGRAAGQFESRSIQKKIEAHKKYNRTKNQSIDIRSSGSTLKKLPNRMVSMADRVKAKKQNIQRPISSAIMKQSFQNQRFSMDFGAKVHRKNESEMPAYHNQGGDDSVQFGTRKISVSGKQADILQSNRTLYKSQKNNSEIYDLKQGTSPNMDLNALQDNQITVKDQSERREIFSYFNTKTAPIDKTRKPAHHRRRMASAMNKPNKSQKDLSVSGSRAKMGYGSRSPHSKSSQTDKYPQARKSDEDVIKYYEKKNELEETPINKIVVKQKKK